MEIRHVIEVMEEIAPTSLAEPWDKIGLQVGEKGWPVQKIWVALDPTDNLIQQASNNNVDLIVCHHPLIFEPLSSVDPGTFVGRIVDLALKHRVGILCAHTNLDAAPGGVNDLLAERLGVSDTMVLQPSPVNQYRLITFIPNGHENKVADALFEAGAGTRDKYFRVSFRSEGIGSFEPRAGANPFLGKSGEMTQAQEYRLEVLVDRHKIGTVLNALHDTHPYEDVVYDLIPIEFKRRDAGLGRIGTLAEELSLQTLVQLVKQRLGAGVAKVVGHPEQRIKRVALCGGSGKSLIKNFLDSNAQVFITADLGYHDGRTIEYNGRALIDIGHFFSEHVVVDGLVARLKHIFGDYGYYVEVDPYAEETCCFRYE